MFYELKKNKFLFSFFFLIFIYNLIQIYEYAFFKYSFQYGDWLINYSNGFVRRGLVGEILLIIKNFFGINLQVLYFSLITIILLFFYIKNFNLLKKINLNLIYLLLILSPFLYLFVVLNHASGIRKEYFLLLLYLFFISDLLDKKPNKTIYFKYTILFQIVLLIHELAIFYLPYFVLLILISNKKKNFKKIKFDFFCLILFSLMTALVLYLSKGDKFFINTICDSLGNSVYANCYKSGAIAESFNQSISSIFKNIISMYDLKGFFSFLLMFLIFFFPFIYFFSQKVKYKNFYFLNLKVNKFIFFIAITFCFIFSLPLFLIGADWGRWLSISYFLIFYLIIFIILKKKIILKKELVFNDKSFLKHKLSKRFFIIIALFLYSSFVTPGVFYEKNTYEKAIKLNYFSIYNRIKN